MTDPRKPACTYIWPRGNAEPKRESHVGGCSTEERRSFVDCACPGGFHDKSHCKLGGKFHSPPPIRITVRIAPMWPTLCRSGGDRATKKLPLAHNCAYAYLPGCRRPCSWTRSSHAQYGRLPIVGPAFLAKLALLRLCGSISASARVFEGRSIRYCNLVPQSKGGFVQEMV